MSLLTTYERAAIFTTSYLFEESLLVSKTLPDPATGVQLGDEAQQTLRAVLVLHVLRYRMKIIVK